MKAKDNFQSPYIMGKKHFMKLESNDVLVLRIKGYKHAKLSLLEILFYT